MASVNKVILVGNLGRDPETRYTTGGEAVTNISIALDGASARVRSNWTVVQNSADGPKIGSGGAYRDELVKEGGQWLLCYRKIDRFIAP